MSFDFHHDKDAYFLQQYLNSKEYVIPFLEETIKVKAGMKVLEIGSAEGGVLKAFTERGCVCTGIEISQSKVDNALIFMKEEVDRGLIHFICKNIYDPELQGVYGHYFDLIILKDTIEHIPDQARIIASLKDYLKPEGHIFFGFPPWHMPWGGHQQICKSKFLMHLPYFHLLPLSWYNGLLRLFNEPDITIKELNEIKSTGISTSRFEKIVKDNGYQIVNKRFYLINPIYKYKFKVKPLKQWRLFTSLKLIRDFYSTTVYYTIKNI